MGKKYAYKFLLPVLIFACSVSFLHASDLNSTNFIIRDPVIGVKGGYGTSTSFELFSSGDKLFTDDASSASFLSRYGFLYYPFVHSGILTALPSGLTADLSWTASVAGGGWNVSGYKIGRSSVSGGPYTYTLVGNVLSYTYGPLAPGDYCFVIQTLDASGNGIVNSNEECITLESTLVFDLDTAANFSNGESSAPYSVSLGNLSAGSVKVSDQSSVQMIVLEADTNAAGGLIVAVQNTNGTDGLVSASAPADTVGSATASMSAGTENYGLCVATAGFAGFSRSGGYSGDACALGSGTNGVQALSTVPTSMLNSGGAPVYGAHAEIVVNGSVSGSTPAHADYGDTLTFIVTGSF